MTFSLRCELPQTSTSIGQESAPLARHYQHADNTGRAPALSTKEKMPSNFLSTIRKGK